MGALVSARAARQPPLPASLTLSPLLLATINILHAHSGSLTTPPCTEGVLWHLLTTPVKITPAQVITLGAWGAGCGAAALLCIDNEATLSFCVAPLAAATPCPLFSQPTPLHTTSQSPPCSARQLFKFEMAIGETTCDPIPTPAAARRRHHHRRRLSGVFDNYLGWTAPDAAARSPSPSPAPSPVATAPPASAATASPAPAPAPLLPGTDGGGAPSREAALRPVPQQPRAAELVSAAQPPAAAPLPAAAAAQQQTAAGALPRRAMQRQAGGAGDLVARLTTATTTTTTTTTTAAAASDSETRAETRAAAAETALAPEFVYPAADDTGCRKVADTINYRGAPLLLFVAAAAAAAAAAVRCRCCPLLLLSVRVCWGGGGLTAC